MPKTLDALSLPSFTLAVLYPQPERSWWCIYSHVGPPHLFCPLLDHSLFLHSLVVWFISSLSLAASPPPPQLHLFLSLKVHGGANTVKFDFHPFSNGLGVELLATHPSPSQFPNPSLSLAVSVSSPLPQTPQAESPWWCRYSDI